MSPDHGYISISGDQLTATYNCDVGYTLAGSDVRQCRTDGSGWSDMDPVCSMLHSHSFIIHTYISHIAVLYM